MPDGLKTFRAAVIGASGYTGGEILRLLLSHPHVTVVALVAHQMAGMTLGEVHPNLRVLGGGLGSQRVDQLIFFSLENHFLPWIESLTADAKGRHQSAVQGDKKIWSIFDEVDVFFFALPHGQTSQMLPRLVRLFESDLIPHTSLEGVGVKRRSPIFLDLSGDFRIQNSDVHEKYYGFLAPDRQVQKQFIYGAPEITGQKKIGDGRFFCMPGCFATACNLGLAPLAMRRLLKGKWVVDCTTGSSGSGQKLGRGTHHPERDENFFAYKSFRHQHLPEIEQVQIELAGCNSNDNDFRVVFQSHSGPFVRGIYATIHGEVTLVEPSGGKKDSLREVFQQFYRKAPMIRIVDQPPQLRYVRGTNFVDIYVEESHKDVVICVALDNLVKGAAGQAVQTMNLALGLDECVGLLQPALVV